MRVLRYNNSSEAPALVAGNAAIPMPGPGEVLIRVRAAGVTPTELRWYPTSHNPDGSPRTGAIPGHEFSGTIEAAGSDVDHDRIGHAVFGMNDWFADGATAEFCLATITSIAAKPDHLSFPEAAIVPIGALTAWQGLIDRAKLKTGERVLIHGGSGAVGIFAVQLARRAGAHVATTAAARNRDFLKQLGADEVIDYQTERFEDSGAPFDVIFDTVGGETLRRSWPLLAPGGRMITIAANNEGTADGRTKNAFFIVEPNGAQLEEMAALLESGGLRVFLDALVPLSEASEAYLGSIPGRKGYGKAAVYNPES